MNISTRFACVTLILVNFLPVTAHAGDCNPLTLMTSLDAIPVKDHAAVLIPMKINDTDVVMLLDTGGVFSEISEEKANALNLEKRPSGLELVGVSGNTADTAAHARSVTLGRLHATGVDFIVSKDFDGNKNFSGILAPNLLTKYDVEFDFAGNKVNLLSQNHCEGKVIYWPADAIAVVAIRVAKSGHIVVPVELDGVQMDALIDTGATKTTLSQRISESDFSLKVNTPDTPDAGALSGSPGARVYSHRFKQLTINGIGVANPSVDIVPDLMNNKLSHAPPIGTRLSNDDEASRLPDLIVGMDILHHLHLYVAYKEEKLYVTPAGAPPAPSSATEQQNATANRPN